MISTISANRPAQEEMIVRDLVDLAHAADSFSSRRTSGSGTDSRPAMSRTRGGRKRSRAGEQRPDLVPQRLVLRRQPDLVAGQPHPGASSATSCARASPCSIAKEGRRRQPRLELQAQALQADARADRDCRRGTPEYRERGCA